MRIDELKNHYTESQLSHYPGNGRLRYKIFSPSLNDLAGRKVVYHEKFVAIVALSEVEVSPREFMAVATIVTNIEQKGRQLFPPRRPWRFGGSWRHIMCSGRHFHVPYANWSIWPEPDLVEAVEELAAAGRFDEALKLTVYESCE